MHALQLWYPKIVHSGSIKSFASFYVPKVSEMTRNTPKHHYGSNGVEWVLQKIVRTMCGSRTGGWSLLGVMSD
jgi:hypothetical protein